MAWTAREYNSDFMKWYNTCSYQTLLTAPLMKRQELHTKENGDQDTVQMVCCLYYEVKNKVTVIQIIREELLYVI
ncbi:hypothetical protein NC651_034868 [Populus alba x Populus x berolinensis]|nr:hypothetical protein NC651_034868 [Populus alba x Populus x berolinensis]